jgi:biopolymer transport protein ExbD
VFVQPLLRIHGPLKQRPPPTGAAIINMQADSGKSYDDINITPMVDLYLVLLLIFIIMTTAGVQGIKVNLPKAGSPANAKIEGPKMQAITVNNEGKVFLNTIPVSLEELEQKLNAIKGVTPEFPVVIRGDSVTQYQGIMDVLDVIGRVGISQVGLATKPQGK